ncbi:hypothetical protein [Fulvimarina manganoxydans]|nr:hypothetical protein [Fulvimarina manganoxydans]
MLMSELHIRPVYASAHAIDQTIFEHAPQSDAATELECVLVEIESMMLPRFRSLGTFAS